MPRPDGHGVRTGQSRVALGDRRAYPHTEQLRTTERYRRVEYGRLEIVVVFDDPGTFTRPWTMNLNWDLAPQEELLEFVCENNRTDLLVGK